uniref:Snake toxin/toxin-like domain-containing protein n=1 Tax=Palpitomonas bilix TaxID=652834 RepID=A0A7S3LVF5_9EUKA|mmetsp:Transcript_49382/g.127305  ORF Transcript_49382/g.127305 Transcript_49382/m.127305 type:complete len:115 (+) Transcript_49382:354-698(+)
MKLFVFVAVLCCAVSVTAISCYSGNNVLGTTASTATCSSSQTYCTKEVTYLLGSIVTISKGCATTCTPVDAVLFGNGAKSLCCTGNLCNSGAVLQPIAQFSLFGLLALTALALF